MKLHTQDHLALGMVDDLTHIAKRAASPRNVINHFNLCPEEQKSHEDH